MLKAAGHIKTVVWIWVAPAFLTAALSIPALLTKNLTCVFAVYAASYLTAAIIARRLTAMALKDGWRRNEHTPALSLVFAKPSAADHRSGASSEEKNRRKSPGSPIGLYPSSPKTECHEKMVADVVLVDAGSRSQSSPRVDVLLALGKALDEENVRYCLIHGWDRLSDLRGDFDLVVEPRGLSQVEKALCDMAGVRLVQTVQYRATGFCFVTEGSDASMCTAFDVATDIRWGGRVLFSADELLRDRLRHAELWIAREEAEAAYLITKKVFKLQFPEHQKRRIEHILDETGPRALEICRTGVR